MQTKYPKKSFHEQDVMEDAFVSTTYNFFLFSIAGIFTCGIGGYFFLPASSLMPLATIDAILWILCGWFGWRNPIGVVFPLFTIVTGFLLGVTASNYAEAGTGHIFYNAAILTIVVFIALTIYVHISKRNFSSLIGFLIAGFWILIVGFLLLWLTGSTLLHVVLSAFGAVVFSGWILFDTSRIVGRWDPNLTPATAAFELFLDIVGLFSYILNLTDLADA